MNASIKQKTIAAAAFIALIAVLTMCTGCKATETLAAGITTKNVSGNGTVVDSRIGIDPDTRIPALKTVFISGDFATVKAGTNQISYREESSASIWNASSVTKKRFLAITLTEKGNVPSAIKAVAEVFREASTTPQAQASGAGAVPAETQPAPTAENTPAQPTPAAK